jgi:hypothetical protein
MGSPHFSMRRALVLGSQLAAEGIHTSWPAATS